jgi:DUF3040 family protein
MLSERERRLLEGIEHQLSIDDPAFVLSMRVPRHRRGWRLPAALVGLALWLAATVVFLMVGAWEAAIASVSAAIAAGLVILVDRTARRRPRR